MIARVYFSNESSEVLGVEAYLRQKGFAVEKVPVVAPVNEAQSPGNAKLNPSVKIVINNSSYGSVAELFEAERKGELPVLLRG